ncbi:hypothetical protein H5410_023021 [Solanum commersonii]|uniref:Uncharacterized protein n=1 Tax=Solanum commersonii TaxID=4109 RepID=A0A9J5ZJ14_SOLCO|nr:hypothetical protein H5410_023021 [Solanum commersonii]
MRKHLEPLRKRKNERVYLRAQRPETKASRLRIAKNRLILGWHYSAADEAKPEPGGDVHILLLNRSPYIYPPRGGVKNHRSQPTLQIIQGLNNRQPFVRKYRV